MSEHDEQPLPPAGWQYQPSESSSALAGVSSGKHSSPGPTQSEITWTASEYIAHHKSLGWYSALLGATVVLAGLVYMLTHDRISTISVIVVALLFGVAAARKPRVLTYVINKDGISIGQRFHSFGEFRSFTVHVEGAFANIELLPLKRFMPLTSIYCSPDHEDDILELLSQHVPYEQPSHSLADTFARRIRF